MRMEEKPPESGQMQSCSWSSQANQMSMGSPNTGREHNSTLPTCGSQQVVFRDMLPPTQLHTWGKQKLLLVHPNHFCPNKFEQS